VIEGDDIALRRFAAYAARRGLHSSRLLGSGKDGVVHEAESNAFPGFVAVKSFHRATGYEREREVYLRLRESGLRKIRSCHVPELLVWNDECLTIEMTMVQPPFILDFADAWLDDEVPEFPEEVWVDWNRKLDDDFGERAGEVRRMLAVLRSHGIVLLDVHPGNIRFR
jgi:hypothetical protein